MLTSESSLRMWIDEARGLFKLPVDHVYSRADERNMRKKRTSAVGTCHVLHLGQFFWWIEGKRLKVRESARHDMSGLGRASTEYGEGCG
jgi:hypothetical protein